MRSLLDPIQVGAIRGSNRIFIASMKRAGGTRDHRPTSVMADYHAQRASADLVLSEVARWRSKPAAAKAPEPAPAE